MATSPVRRRAARPRAEADDALAYAGTDAAFHESIVDNNATAT